MKAGPAHSGLGLCAWTSPGRDTFIVTLGNAVTSILAGFAIFSVLGYMSQELGVPVDQVAKAGGPAAQPWWVRVCVGHSWGWAGGTRVDLQGCGWLWPVCVWMCAHAKERVLPGLWVCKCKGCGWATCVCREMNFCARLSSVLLHLSNSPCLSK